MLSAKTHYIIYGISLYLTFNVLCFINNSYFKPLKHRGYVIIIIIIIIMYHL